MAIVNNRRVTIKQVALAAGVSTQTVSRVVNERPDVAPDTRQRVLEVIERLGYRPNVLARNLIRQRSQTLGVVTAGLDYIGPSRTLNGITDQSTRLGYNLLLKELPSFQYFDVASIIDELLARQVEGIIWAVQEVGGNRKDFEAGLAGLDVPIVFLTMKDRPGYNIVAVDNYLGGRMATEHLLELGHRCIGHISGPLDWWEAGERKRGWEDALVAAGIGREQRCWMEGTWSSRSGERSIKQLLERLSEMSAVFAANDQMALGVLLHAHRQGISVPGDLAIVGFDGIPESEFFWPPLTTINHNQQELGCLAVTEIVKAIELKQNDQQELDPKSILIAPELVVRDSTVGLATS
jgi:LacI family transcriptional regulator